MFIECDDVLTLKINIIELNHPVCENNNELYIQHYTLLEENSQEKNIHTSPQERSSHGKLYKTSDIIFHGYLPVSYTHLTLPTIYSV